ncbi:hypothetical protein EC973_001193 [Apophysomyces ossiformis]|uniref:Uncharacterized protein n=1 Tax=Apophysomyces ossiformis TaxID=679940 RepID=A0A8H7BQE0_9FUNG|nr:hypothetical protein EC973_001193 [Apophysomyces ossiformis]
MIPLEPRELNSLIGDVYKIIKESVDDWVKVLPEALELKGQCTMIDRILPYIDKGLCEDSYQYQFVVDMKHILDSAQTEINKFLARETKERNLFGKFVWNSKRVYLAMSYRESFKKKAEEMARKIEKIMQLMQLADILNEPMVDLVKNHLSKESYEFWTTYVGRKISPDKAWAIFIQQYQFIYGRLDEETVESIRRVACINGTDLTIYGFVQITKDYGFPIEVDSLPPLHLSNVVMSEEGRMEITKMVMNLMSDHSSKKMHQSVKRVDLWYKDINRDDKQALRRRADEWGHYIVESRKKGMKSPIHKEAEELDFARRTISMFYQRYMAIWRIGRVSRGMLSDVDFPGKSRIRCFIRDIEPLDNANYRIVFGNDIREWDHRRPKVYNFLRELVQ